LVPGSAIRARVRQVAAALDQAYPDDDFVVVSLMNGALFFAADLLRAMRKHPRVECWRVGSYPGAATASSGRVSGVESSPGSFEGASVLVLDDILDTGLTLGRVVEEVRRRGARRVRSCVLLRKKVKRAVAVRADWAAFDIPNKFVVGYGLDWNGLYRQLPDIRVAAPVAVAENKKKASVPPSR